MSKKVILQQVPSSTHRRQPLLNSGKAKTGLGEAVGGTAAVCCCGPCAVANIVFLAFYKVPASLCQKALKKRKQRRRHKATGEGLYPPRKRCTCGCCDDVGFRVHPTCGNDDDVAGVKGRGLEEEEEEEEEDKEVMELEKEMWDMFYSAGFWRSPSQIEDSSFSSSSSSSSSSSGITASASAPNLQVLAVSNL